MQTTATTKKTPAKNTISLNGLAVYSGRNEKAAHDAWCEAAPSLRTGDELVWWVNGTIHRATVKRAAG